MSDSVDLSEPVEIKGESGNGEAQLKIFNKESQNDPEVEQDRYKGDENCTTSVTTESVELEMKNNTQTFGVLYRDMDDQATAESQLQHTNLVTQSKYTKVKGPQINLSGNESGVPNHEETERSESVEQHAQLDVKSDDTETSQERMESVEQGAQLDRKSDDTETGLERRESVNENKTRGRSEDNEEHSDDKKKEALAKLKKAKTNDDPDEETHIWKNPDEQFKEAKEKYTYFWKSYDVFSQWHPSKFTVGSNKFSCAEQYMMYQKAILFGSDRIANKVLHTTDPRTMKSLGRQVQQFKDNIWVWHCLGVVRDGSMHKYTQNAAMKESLYSTYPTILVEASPYDSVWGIGLDKKDQRAWDESQWEGMNLLGYILTEVRDELMCTDGIIPDNNRKIYLNELQDKLFKRNLDNDPGTSVDPDWEVLW